MAEKKKPLKDTAPPRKSQSAYGKEGGKAICVNAKCKLRKQGCRGFHGCPGFVGRDSEDEK